MPLPKSIDVEAYDNDPLVVLPVTDPLPAPTDAQRAAFHAALGDCVNAHIAAASTDDKGNSLAAVGNIRAAVRANKSVLNSARLGAAQARAELDEADIGLRTAQYELARVREEMAVCRAYEPMYTALEMPSEEDFLAAADPEVLAALPLGDEGKYPLQIARLEAELAHIIAQEDRLAELTRERDAIVKSRREVTKKFSAADVFLGDFAKTTNAMGSKLRDVTKGVEREKAEEK